MTALRKGFRLVHARLAPCLVSGLLAIGPLGNAWAGDVRYAYDAGCIPEIWSHVDSLII
jgi:hypothetical protein